MPKNGQSKELLEFPCKFPIKIIGKANEGMILGVLRIFQLNIPDFDEKDLTVVHSKEKHYQSITVEAYVTSQEQLDEIYRQLSSHEHVMFVL